MPDAPRASRSRRGRGGRAAVRRPLAPARPALRAARARPGRGRGRRAGRVRRDARAVGAAARPGQGAGLPAPGRRQPLALGAAAPRRRRAARRTAPAGEGTVDGPGVGGARRDAVRDALLQLSERQREVLVLRHYLDWSEAQIADALGISRGAVKAHAHRAAPPCATSSATGGRTSHERPADRDLLHEVADGVEPGDRLDAIRAATPRSAYAPRAGGSAGGAGLVAASVVTALALTTGGAPQTGGHRTRPGPETPATTARGGTRADDRAGARSTSSVTPRPAPALPRAPPASAATRAPRPSRSTRRCRATPSTPTTAPRGPRESAVGQWLPRWPTVSPPSTSSATSTTARPA